MQIQKKTISVPPSHGMPFSSAVRAGDFIYISGIMATDANGRLAAGDVRAQTKQVLDNLQRVVEASGSSMPEVASVFVYLKSASDFSAMNEVYAKSWPKDPPVRTTVATGLVLPGALVEMSAIAIPKGGERKVIHPIGWMKPKSPYSHGILSGNTLFVAGQISSSGSDNSFAAGEASFQTRQALNNASKVLLSVDMTVADIASSRVYLSDVKNFRIMNEAYQAYFSYQPSIPPPARATVKAGLMSPEAAVEISVVAVKRPNRKAFTTPNADGTPGRPNPNLSSALHIDNRLFVSGMLGNTDSNKGDVRSQTRETLARIGRTLRLAGFDWKDVVDGVVYLTDARGFNDMNEAYREVFTKDFPARATVVTGLVAPDGLVEIMFTAVKP